MSCHSLEFRSVQGIRLAIAEISIVHLFHVHFKVYYIEKGIQKTPLSNIGALGGMVIII